MNDFRPAILRELNRQCATDFLGRHMRPFYDSTRITWSRMNAIVEMARRDGTLPNATKLAEKFQTCTKTITRDIAHLRKSGRLLITYNSGSFDYSVSDFPSASSAESAVQNS